MSSSKYLNHFTKQPDWMLLALAAQRSQYKVKEGESNELNNHDNYTTADH